jgi:hypothetical protein
VQGQITSYIVKLLRVTKILQCIFHKLVYFHDGCFITTSVTVVGCWEDCYYVSLMGPVVSIHDQLMSTGDEFQVVGMVELLRDVLSEGVTSTTRWNTPSTTIIGIWPKQIANGSINKEWLFCRKIMKISMSYPSWGTSWTLSNCLIWSRVSMLGERPPWRQNIWPSTTAVSGK